MREYELELAVGDVVQIGEMTVTVVDIDGPDVSFRIDSSPADGSVLEITGAHEFPRHEFF